MIELPGYTLQRQLGRGGMALVYLATQESLHRDVALKFLTPSQDDQAGERFLREARLAASLHHPHIVPIHDFGVHDGQAWLAMQYLPLGTVSPPAGERLESGAALRIVRDIASALDYAHGHGVVHRDIKPDNILRGENGAVLSDFGIARLIQGESALTREGTSVGTPHYMSPEQLRGERVDGRSDLYSLGVVLWQLLTGELPYTGTDGWAIGTQHLNADIPRLPAALAHLQPLMDALLAKTADARPRTGAEVVQRIDALLATQAANDTTPIPSVTPGARTLDTPPSTVTIQTQAAANPAPRRTAAIAAGIAIITLLAWLGWRQFVAPPTLAVAHSPAAAEPVVAQAPSLAVLPFDDLSEKHDQSYFSDGMAEEVSIRLAQVEGLRVAGRASAQSFKGKNATIAEVGKVLNVSRVLEGTVRRSGDQLRVTVQLSNVADGFQLWSQTFDRKLTDVFAVQDEIAGAVVDTLKLKLLASPRKHTPSIDVYDLYLRGRQSLIRANRENSLRAREALRKAVALDPAYAEAYGLLAMAEVFLSPGPRDPQGRAETMRLAMAAAERAVALDPALGDAYGARGFLRRIQLDWGGALADTEKSVMLGPREGRNYLRYGLMLETVGRLKEAQAELEHAVELEPLLTPAWNQLGRTLMARGDIANARRAFTRVDSIDPDYQNDPTLEGDLLLLEGRADEARASYAASEGGELGVIMADYSLGKVEAARHALDRIAAATPELDPCNLAVVHAWLGQPSKAFVQLDRALATRDTCLVYVGQNPFLRSLRDDARFDALLKKLVAPAGAAEPAP